MIGMWHKLILVIISTAIRRTIDKFSIFPRPVVLLLYAVGIEVAFIIQCNAMWLYNVTIMHQINFGQISNQNFCSGFRFHGT